MCRMNPLPGVHSPFHLLFPGFYSSFDVNFLNQGLQVFPSFISVFIETMPHNWRQRTSWLSLVHPQSHEEQQALKAQKRGSKFRHRPLLLRKSLLIHRVHVRPPKTVHFVSPVCVFVVISDWYRCRHKLSLIDVNSYCNVYRLKEDIWACWWDG